MIARKEVPADTFQTTFEGVPLGKSYYVQIASKNGMGRSKFSMRSALLQVGQVPKRPKSVIVLGGGEEIEQVENLYKITEADLRQMREQTADTKDTQGSSYFAVIETRSMGWNEEILRKARKAGIDVHETSEPTKWKVDTVLLFQSPRQSSSEP